jgi:DNA-binding NarL/FixJ family response regulator
MDVIYTMLVDDNARYRASLAALLTQWPAICVVAEADSGSRALELVAQHRPDLLLVDIVMPGMSGIELTRQLKALDRPPRVLVLTMHALPIYRRVALAAGADDLLMKDQVTKALVPAIRRLFPAQPDKLDGDPPADSPR